MRFAERHAAPVEIIREIGREHCRVERGALDAAMLATDLADYLVRRGVPFREAHRLVGAAVKIAEARGVALANLSLDEYTKIAPEFGADIKAIFDFARSVASHEISGGTGPNAVRAQITRAREIVDRGHKKG
jgi:argininosuccinate lyase